MNSAGRDMGITCDSTTLCEALLLADQLRDWCCDDPRLAPRTIRLRALLVELLERSAGPESIAEAGGT